MHGGYVGFALSTLTSPFSCPDHPFLVALTSACDSMLSPAHQEAGVVTFPTQPAYSGQVVSSSITTAVFSPRCPVWFCVLTGFPCQPLPTLPVPTSPLPIPHASGSWSRTGNEKQGYVII